MEGNEASADALGVVAGKETCDYLQSSHVMQLSWLPLLLPYPALVSHIINIARCHWDWSRRKVSVSILGIDYPTCLRGSRYCNDAISKATS
jgi:hypothetical protein